MYNDPDRFTARTVFQSSMDIFMAILSMVIPALLTRMSILPCSSRTSWTTRWQSSGRETLPWWTLARPGPSKSRANSLTNCSARSRLPLYPAATEAPWLARLLQMAAPIPRVPPVTSATRPASLSPINPVAGSIMVELMVFIGRLPGCFRRSHRDPRISPQRSRACRARESLTFARSYLVLLLTVTDRRRAVGTCGESRLNGSRTERGSRPHRWHRATKRTYVEDVLAPGTTTSPGESLRRCRRRRHAGTDRVGFHHGSQPARAPWRCCARHVILNTSPLEPAP